MELGPLWCVRYSPRSVLVIFPTMISTSDPVALNLHAFSNTTEEEFLAQLEAGKRFVVYHYAVSLVVYTFRHPTRIHVAENRKKAVLNGLPWTVLTALSGWWSIPSGPVFTVQCLLWNLRGGTDVSSYILEHIRNQDPRYQYGML